MTPMRRSEHAPPVRMAHLGLGAFHRSHQAWWTGAVGLFDPWGVAAFTFIAPDLADDDAVVADLEELVSRHQKGR